MLAPATRVPISNLLSPEGAAYVAQHLRDMQNPDLRALNEEGVALFLAGYLARQRELFPVNKVDTTIGGVHVYDYTPQGGMPRRNRNRVLINLHGGGFQECWPACAELESIPIAHVGAIRVVSIDYRQSPNHQFPAASEDVAAVYRELLRRYPPENVGIYGCSAGGMLTGMSVAWFQRHGLPRPGAVGVFCAGLTLTDRGFGGDAVYTTSAIGEGRAPPAAPRAGDARPARPPLPYLANADLQDALVAPAVSDEVLSRFPPTLIITGTRAFELSSAAYTHSRLVRLGVNADLHVWEGMFHGFYSNPDVPESRDAYNVIARFFDRHLGREPSSARRSFGATQWAMLQRDYENCQTSLERTRGAAGVFFRRSRCGRRRVRCTCVRANGFSSQWALKKKGERMDGGAAKKSVDFAVRRRSLLTGAALAAGLAAGGGSYAQERGVAGSRDESTIVARAGVAIVETEAGKVAGYVRNGIFAFKGIPYGDTTAGPNRFLPPKKPTPWSGVRSSRSYGPVCPQNTRTGWVNDEEAFMFQWNDGFEGEDCLRMNVWTAGVSDNARRPVVVWLHGGGFTAGSGHELPSYDGENLARRGDVVVVSLNHRLNALGFLDLSSFGDRYARSGNVGMLDIVLALEWVRDNIAAFGGDPQRVTIMGQSGGGAKVSTLMAMPAAQGLFHRAVVQSGSFSSSNTQDRSQRLAGLIAGDLGLSAATINRIHDLPYSDLRRAADAVLRRENPPFTGFVDIRRSLTRLGFGPVVDGDVLPAAPFSPQAPAISARVPMIIGSTLNEFVTAMNHPEYELLTEAELLARVEERFAGSGRRVVNAFRRRTPEASPFDLWSRIATAQVRQGAIDQARRKSALNSAHAYLYWFTWQTPVFDGRPRAFHCADIPFVFANTDRCEQMTGGGRDARALAARMADAIIQFARTGDPNHAGMPRWESFSRRTMATMIFDNDTRLALGPDREELESVAAA